MSDTHPRNQDPGNPTDSESKKRQRTDADELASEEELVKDTQVWLPDGNIVLISKNIAFRVHKSVLSLHSEVFRDLFLLPPPPTGEKTFEGCPTVRMSDTPDDLRHLLLVVCGGKDYYHENDEVIPVPCRALCSLVRMGHKYAIPKVLNDALSRLKRYYTSDLSTWSDKPRRAKHVSVWLDDDLRVIEVAYLTNTSSILPSAFLNIAQCLEINLVRISNQSAPYPCGLTLKLVQQAVSGKVAIIANMTGRIMSLHTAVPALQCLTADHCMTIAHQALRSPGIWNILFALHLQPLYRWHWGRYQDQLCPPCRDASKAKDLELLQLEWNELPKFFGLHVDGWPV